VRFGREQFLWTFEHLPEDASRKSKKEEKERAQILLEQLNVGPNVEVDFLAVMCGLAFFSKDYREERMRFMFSLFMGEFSCI
jgi:hypothetical protein